MKKKKHRLIPNKSVLFVVAVSILLLFMMGLITYHKVSALMVEQSKQSSMSLAQAISAQLDGDRIKLIRSQSDPSYAMALGKLRHYTEYSYVKYLYIMRLEEDGRLTFVVDADYDNPLALGTEYEWLDDMAPAFFEGEVCCDSKVSSDEWGNYYSAYAPIFDSDGAVVAIVGVDVEVSDINVYLNKMMWNLALIIFLTAAAAAILFFFFSAELTGWDSLTGLMNYDMLIKRGNKLRKNKELEHYTAILVNIKGFKYINRQYGYDFGNEILKNVADFLKAGVNRKELICRTGNDNFCILVLRENTNAYMARLQEANPVSLEAAEVGQLPVPVRCGVYEVSADDSIEQVMGICTVVMNVARKGKQQDLIYYNKEMYENILKEGDILSAYKRAIRDGEFKVFYQPKVDIRSNTLCGAEALVRWYMDGTMISPATFIPLLENEGLVTELDFYVFETVCNDIRLWKSQGLSPVPVSTNFSKLHLSDPEFADRVVQTADKWQIEHRYLAVEMTESSGYSDMEALTDFVTKMSETGIRVNMDDFGTGYSSLSLLGDVDMDIIKIDKSFVDRIFGEKENGARLVRSVIRMITELEREVICEGVETKKQVEFLKETQCHMVQGYFFDKPLEHDSFTARLKQPVYGNT